MAVGKGFAKAERVMLQATQALESLTDTVT